MRVLACGLFAVLVATVVQAAPEPAVVPAPGQWTVDARFTHPQQIVLRMGPQREPVCFWYVLLTITNNTGRDIDFYPRCDLMTDTFHIYPAGRGVTPAVFAAIKQRHQSQYPFLERLELAGSKILQGQDNAKDLAIIWPDFDPKAKSFKIFISGLSNETVVIDHPVAKDKDGKPLKVFLRKTLQLDYAIKGDPALRSQIELTFKGKRWIMR